MNSTPVLVVIPLYNARAYIAQAVNSILTQSYPNFHILVIDDGSSDGGGEIVTDMKDQRITLWQQENSGPGPAMNRAIAFAGENSFPLIARMDSDDISLPNRLEVQVKLLNSAGSDTAACSSNCYYIDQNTERVIGTSTIPIRSALIKWEIKHGLRGLIQPSLMARTEALSSVGGYREKFILAEESDLFLRLSERFSLTNSPDYLCKIRIRTNSLSLSNVDENLWYSMYALDCWRRRKMGKTEKSYKEFRKSTNALTRYRFWRERQLLINWRGSMTSQNLPLLLLAGLVDPYRVISRILRSMDAQIHKRV